MLQTVLDACTFKEDAIAFALTDQIEDLSDLAGHTPSAAEAFFDKTYVTDGMATLLRQGLQRLAGTNKQAIFFSPTKWVSARPYHLPPLRCCPSC